MAADWFVIVNDEVRGPYTADQMRSAAKSGLVQASTSVRKGSDGDWFRADQIQGLLQPPGSNTAASAPARETQQSAAEPKSASSVRPQQPQPTAAINEPLPQIVTAGRSSAESRVSKTTRGPNRRRSNPWPVIAVGVVAVGLLLGMLYALANSGGGDGANGQPRKPTPHHMRQLEAGRATFVAFGYCRS